MKYGTGQILLAFGLVFGVMCGVWLYTQVTYHPETTSPTLTTEKRSYTQAEYTNTTFGYSFKYPTNTSLTHYYEDEANTPLSEASAIQLSQQTETMIVQLLYSSTDWASTSTDTTRGIPLKDFAEAVLWEQLDDTDAVANGRLVTQFEERRVGDSVAYQFVATHSFDSALAGQRISIEKGEYRFVFFEVASGEKFLLSYPISNRIFEGVVSSLEVPARQ